jgi:hypothetical protein
MKVQLNSLPKDILNQIPLSIRTSNTEYNINSLPENIKYLINKYYLKQRSELVYSENVYDIKPIINKYNDFMVLNQKYTVIEYFKNYLKIHISTYPYDVEFGCRLKEYLQTKDSSMRETQITTELNNIINILINDYGILIRIKSSQIIRNPQYNLSSYIFTEYILVIELFVDNEEITITI